MLVPFRPRRRRRPVWAQPVVIAAAGLAAATAVVGALVRSNRIASATPTLDIRVVDGDTIDALVPPGREIVRYRLVGFDTPETVQARCGAELALGERAKRRLQDLIAKGPVRVEVREAGRTDRWG